LRRGGIGGGNQSLMLLRYYRCHLAARILGLASLMGFWRNIAGIAARRVDDADCPDCPSGPPGEDPAFSTAVTALGAKLAKADGRADASEFDAFAEAFQPAPGGERDIRRLYDLARQTTHGFESYAKRLARRYRKCPQLLEDVLDGLFHIAKSDGAVTADELRYLDQVGELFGLHGLTLRRIRAMHLGGDHADPYVIVGAPHDASDEAVHQAWRRALAEAHPDRAVARGLPPEYVEVAQIKSAAINAAFDVIMRERRALSAVGAL
jgi:DnaJ like chaperone protein